MDKVNLNDFNNIVAIDRIKRPLLRQDNTAVKKKITELRQLDGESWAIAETASRVLEYIEQDKEEY